jgi:hypothetical protein
MSADPLQATRLRQTLARSRASTLVVYVPTDKAARLRLPQPNLQSVRDRQIPIGCAQPDRAPSSPRFPPYEAFERRPRTEPARLQTAGVRNPSVDRSLRIASANVAVGGKADIRLSRVDPADSQSRVGLELGALSSRFPNLRKLRRRLEAIEGGAEHRQGLCIM